MLAQERYAAIMQMIRETNVVKIGDIADKLKVSNETARRDLETLQDQKLLKRVHGGAVLQDSMIGIETSTITLPKKEISFEEKSSIGKIAADMVRNGETIFIDIGITTLQIAKHLKKKKDITVLTTSLAIANELAATDVSVVILGGKVIKDDLHISSPFTAEIFSKYYVDKSFIGCGGVTNKGIVTDYSELCLNRSIVRDHSSKMILVADSGKFWKQALVEVCKLDILDAVISDTNLPKEYKDIMEESGVNLILAPAKP